MDIVKDALAGQLSSHLYTWGKISAQDIGVWHITPHSVVDDDVALIVSVGVHGNETAPIEIVASIIQDIAQGVLIPARNMLLILGNIEAMRAGVRYLEWDINRLFLGGESKIGTPKNAHEFIRAQALAEHTQTFIKTHKAVVHLDLHTAIRQSYLPTFALLPPDLRLAPESAHTLLHRTLHGCALDALVTHQSLGHTFSSHTQNLGAAAATLELGRALPFGQNNLGDFAPSDKALRALISADVIADNGTMPRQFVVADSIIKSDDFALTIDATLPNFDFMPAHTPIARTHDSVVCYDFDSYMLFANPNVAVGARAGLILQEVGLEVGL